jgi:ABC-2 type transport system ATP-binding protein
MYAIELEHLTKVYVGKGRSRVEALKDVSFVVEAGEIFGFLGPNGAGKSTTIKIIMGLIRPTSGDAHIAGYASSDPESRRYVGFLPENPAFYDYLTAEEYLRFTGNVFRMSAAEITSKSDEVLNKLDLWEARRRPVRSFSKGMVQRLGLAQVLLHDPDVYVLDEPMSGLDPLGRALVKDIIRDLKSRGKSVFFSTHITSDVETVCDRVGIIFKGELQAVEHVESVLTAGIIGYHIRLKDRTSTVSGDVYVAKEDLAAFVAEQQANGTEISCVEPRRKNLEDFFLEIVKGRGR